MRRLAPYRSLPDTLQRLAAPAIPLLLLLVMSGCEASTGPGEIDEPQDRILFVRGSGAECTGVSCDRDIYGMNLDGSDLVNMTNAPAQYRDLRLSPDRQQLAFVSNRSGCPNIWTMATDGTDLRQLTGLEPGSRCNQDPRWSPDGEWLAFFSSDDLDLGWEVHVIRPDGIDRANITNHPADDLVHAFTWDGRLVIISDRDGGHYYVMNRDGTGLERLFPDEQEGAEDLHMPYWSTNGALAVFVQGVAGANDLQVTPTGDLANALTVATGGPVRPFGSFPSNPWSPDGTRLALWRWDGSDNVNIWVVNADGSGLTNLTNSTAADYFDGWSPDGSRILFTTDRDGNREIYMVNADGSGLTNLTDDPADDMMAVWVPAGS